MSALANSNETPYLDLTNFVPAAALDELDRYLLEEGIGGANNAAQWSAFLADDSKHSECVELCDKDTSSWPELRCDAEEAFATCRRRRGDARTWRPNVNGERLPGVFDFVRASPIFSSTGKIAILKNERGCRGVEHVDHRLPDLVSEFVWVRPAWSTKQFFVKDACLRTHVVPPSVRVLWFDDHLPHGIHPVDADAQVSIRVDGVFRPLFREYVCRFGMFGDVGFDGVSLAAVLWAQAPPEDDDGG